MDILTTDLRVKKGAEFAEQIWWRLAKRIVQIAGEKYNWTDDEWRDASEKFLRPNDYKVIITLPS
jgi:hypothetical protein